MVKGRRIFYVSASQRDLFVSGFSQCARGMRAFAYNAEEEFEIQGVEFMFGMRWAIVFIAVGMLVFSGAQAAKFGGGKSFGYKKPIQYRALDQKKPVQQSGKQAQTGAAASGAAAGKAGLLGGLLAGGLLAALFFGGAFEGMTAADWLVLLLIAGGLFWFFRRRQRAALAPAAATVQKVSHSMRHTPLQIGSGVADTETEAVEKEANALPAPPAWFDEHALTASLEENFKAVQQAWDAGDVETLQSYCTEACFEQIRDAIRPGEHQTEIEQVTAQIIDWDYDADQFVVSVRFSGFVRENGASSRGFTEVWHLVRPVDGQDRWRIAGVQQV
ncbi:MAG TPA: Tim44 domain-containing protein [Sulfurivirga caldicuralii]|nr:Tim44 domain-containing protein [Sulfurivirga caldicuralii]